jgi:hypothetical protein
MPNVAEQINDLLQQEIQMPNLPLKVMDAGVMWNTLMQSNGWKLEQNEFTRHCRIIDPNGIKRAWGNQNGMLKAFDEFLNNSK